MAGAVLSLDPGRGAERRYETGGPVGCVALREDDAGLLLGLAGGFGRLDLGDGLVAMLAPAGHDTALMQLNDGGCDPAGRFHAGSITRDASAGASVLYRYQPPGGVRAPVTGIGVSNGMAWDSAGTTFFFVDSLTRRARGAEDGGPGHVQRGNRRRADDQPGHGQDARGPPADEARFP